MRNLLILMAATSSLLLSGAAGAQQTQPPPAPAQSSTSSADSGASQSVADAARKAKTQKTDAQAAPKSPRVFDNDSIPKTGGISSVGSSSGGGSGSGDSAKGDANSGGATGALNGNDEKGWKALFAGLYKRLQQDQEELDIDQRELGKDDVQFYNDPVKGMQQGLTRSDINDKTAKIDSLKQKVDADNKAISDAEDQLRAAGGDSGWAR